MSRSMEVYRRRLKVRNLFLQGYRNSEICEKLGLKPSIVSRDLSKISSQYTKMVTENPHILARQAEYIQKHLDQLQLIKQKLWSLQTETKSDRAKIDALKALLTELEHESRVLKLVDSSKTIIKNYIHIDKLTYLMDGVAKVIREFVPLEKQQYAFNRLKLLGTAIDTPAKVVDAEVVDEKRTR